MKNLLRRHSILLLFSFTVAAPATMAHARPTAPELFCKVYPTATQCRGSVVSCTVCHTSAPSLNGYGGSIASVLDRSRSFEQALPGALAETETGDADADGKSNAQEFAEGTFPGNPSSVFAGEAPQAASESPEFAFRRVSVAFCGVSPTFEEMEALRSSSDKKAFTHSKLDTCLKSDYWRKEALVHIADPLVRPVALLGHCGLAFLDFEPDYNIFLWAMTGGRDASEILTAKYFVEESATGELQTVEEASTNRTRAGVKCSSFGGTPGAVRQNVAPPYRAGVLTTANFLLNNSQDAYIPRVSAGIAYRNWFGADIAQYQALYSVPQEPRDIDKKGLKDPVCASCHSTLDPIAYAYSYYYGGGPSQQFGAYARERPEVFLGGLGATRDILDDWYNDQPVPRVFGKAFSQEYKLPEDTSSLVQIAAEVAKSDLFARHITRLVFREVVGGDPEPRDADEFAQLWQGLRTNKFSVDNMCHALIDTKAFGSPI
jgi:hypothetical protein